MTPERKYLTRNEIVQVIRDTVPEIVQAQMFDHLATVNERLDGQDRVLQGIQSSVTSAIGDGNGTKGFLQQMHEDNNKRLDQQDQAIGRVQHSVKNVLQGQENVKAIEDGRREEREAIRLEKEAEQRAKDEKWDRWQKRITWMVGVTTAGAGILTPLLVGLQRLNVYFHTGHWFIAPH